MRTGAGSVSLVLEAELKFLQISSACSPSSETQGRGQSRRDKRWRKFSKTGERTLGCYSWQLIETSICHATFVIFLYKGVYLETRMFAVPVWLVEESFEKSFQGPQKPKISHNISRLAKQNKTIERWDVLITPTFILHIS